MLSVQLGSALSLDLIASVGAAGTAWLRLTMGALVFLAVARPPLRAVRARDVPALLGLGVTTGLQTIAFLAAIERIPLGTCVAIEFLGPLTVAALRSHSRRALACPVVALAGVALLTQPWHGAVDATGLALAGVAAFGWAGYILLTQQVGDRFTGITGLSLTVPVAAATAAVLGVPEAIGHLTVGVLVSAAGLAVLLPVLPYALEMLALRHMTHTAFGTLMSLEPAIGILLGLLVLHQEPSADQLAGVVLVVLAGSAAQRDGRRGMLDVVTDVIDGDATRRVLEAKLAEVEEQLTSMSKPPTEQGNISFGKRVGDGTQMAVDRLAQVAVHDRLRLIRDDVVRALAKLDDGSYGRCDVCGQPIPAGRLEALPWAVLCLEHASRRDRP
jgi:inner membrane transporter RhtA